MIPDLIEVDGTPWAVLPPGVHNATLNEIAARYAYNMWRREMFDGLVDAAGRLQSAGCPRIYLDGSYVTAKPWPADYDACWDSAGVDQEKMDPLFFEFANGRAAQKFAFKGEFFPSSSTSSQDGPTFLQFFQFDRFTGSQKGILSVELSNDPTLTRRRTHDLQ